MPPRQTYLALFLSALYQRSGAANFETTASLMTFFVIGIGGLGSLSAGWLADRWGRNYTTMLSMAISGTAAMQLAGGRG